MSEWVRIQNNTDGVRFFRAADVVAVQTRSATYKPTGWCDWNAALLTMRDHNAFWLTDDDWEQVRPQLGIAQEPMFKPEAQQ